MLIYLSLGVNGCRHGPLIPVERTGPHTDDGSRGKISATHSPRFCATMAQLTSDRYASGYLFRALAVVDVIGMFPYVESAGTGRRVQNIFPEHMKQGIEKYQCSRDRYPVRPGRHELFSPLAGLWLDIEIYQCVAK
jgi:hypothetical protein